MAKKNPHVGSSFQSWLDHEGIREEVTSAAVKAIEALSEEERTALVKRRNAGNGKRQWNHDD
jgi:hypothetical protein